MRETNGNVTRGTTAVACIKERRNYIGFELNKEYYKKAMQRIDAERRQHTHYFSKQKKTKKTMTAHIILASIFLLSVLSGLIFDFLDHTSMYHDFDHLISTFIIIGVFSMLATIVQGVCCNDKIHYRKHHAPLIGDVNNGYAKLIEYQTVKNGDTILFYNIEWLGSNQDGEREVNNK